jgi:hypothetical protein
LDSYLFPNEAITIYDIAILATLASQAVLQSDFAVTLQSQGELMPRALHGITNWRMKFAGKLGRKQLAPRHAHQTE